jgi:hypothetical protein
VSPSLSVAAEFDYGHEGLPLTPTPLSGEATQAVSWKGLALFAKMPIAPKISFSPRYEWYSDPEGATTGGTKQTLNEFTATFEIKPNDNLQWRIEYRGDWSDIEPFLDSDGKPKGSQNSIGTALLLSWSGKIQ